jgi:hypothetical protein
MADFSIRSDSVNVEEIMGQIRARIREKRGVDYTEQEIRELAAVKLEKFLDPTKVRSDLLEQFRQLQRQQMSPNIELDEETLFGSPRPWVRRARRWLRPILKLFLNPVPLMRASRVNETMVRHAELFYELVHNLVVETTRLGIEVKTLKMRVESLSSRLDFDERRARALEGAVQYRPATPAQEAAPGAARKDEEEAEAESGATRGRRRRRRRGRRGGGQRGGAEESAGTGDTAQAAREDRPRAEAPPAGEGEPGDRSVGHAPPPETTRDVTATPASTRSETPPREAGHAPEQDRGDREPGS